MKRLRDFGKRLALCLLGLVPGMWLGWVYAPELLEVLVQPLLESLKRVGLDPKIHLSLPLEQTIAHMKIAIFTGVVANVPWTAWQMWGFLSTGMDARRRWRYAIGFSASSTLFFGGGVMFAFTIVIPFVLGSFTMSGPMHGGPSMLSEYLTFVTRTLLAFGGLFEIPVVVTTVYAAGIATWKRLLALGSWWVPVAAFLSALVTPPDVGSQLLLLVPAVLLYFGSAVLARFVVPSLAVE